MSKYIDWEALDELLAERRYHHFMLANGEFVTIEYTPAENAAVVRAWFEHQMLEVTRRAKESAWMKGYNKGQADELHYSKWRYYAPIRPDNSSRNPYSKRGRQRKET